VGSKTLGSMKLWQAPASYPTGDVTIKYWDGTSLKTVTNQSPSGFPSSISYYTEQEFTFNSANAQYWLIECKTHASSPSTNYIGLAGWQLLSGRDPVSTVLTKGSDSYDIGTASSIYIDATGTYDAQAKNSNTFVIKTSNVVSGSITRKLDYSSIETTINGDDLDGADNYGQAMCGYGDTVAIAAPGEDTGVSNSGAVYIWKRTGTTWTQEAKLKSPTPGSAYYFGFGQMSMIENKIAIGEIGANKVHIFTRSGTTWTLAQTLSGSNNFGRGVALYGNYLAVGADTYNSNRGRVHIYTLSSGTYGSEVTISSPHGNINTQFGYVLSLYGTSLAVGAYADDQKAYQAGRAYIYVKESGGWVHQASLDDDLISNEYAHEVFLIDADTLLFGNSQETGGNGKVYYYTRSGTTWTKQQTITASDGGNTDLFGKKVWATSDTLIVGARNWEGSSGTNRGKIYIYEKESGIWTEKKTYTKVNNAADSDYFGESVWTDGTYFIAGAMDADDKGTTSGSAHVYEKVYVGPTLTYDNSNKLSLTGVTTPSSNLTVGTNTYDIGSAKDVYIKDQGTYTFHTNDGDQALILNKTVSSDPSGTTYNYTTGTAYTITTDSLFFNYEAWNYSGSGNWLNQVNTANNPGVFPSSITYNSTSPKSFVFNNSNTERINIGNVDMQQDWTLECWAKLATVSSAGLFGHGVHSTQQGLHCVINSGTSLKFGFHSNDLDVNYSFQADTWYHLVFVYDRSNSHNKKTYINGEKKADANQSSYNRGTDEFSIGNTYSNGTNGNQMQGEIAVARMYTKCLTAEEIGVNYAAGYLGSTLIQNTGNTPSQTYDNTKTITVSNIPSGTSTVGKIYKGATAYTIHATEPTSNVIIKNTGSYVSVFTTSSTAYFTNTVNVNATPTTTSEDNTIEDESTLVTTTVSVTKKPDGLTEGNAAFSGWQLAQDFPDYQSDYYWIKSSNMPNALQMWVDMDQEGGGYDFYAFIGNGNSVRQQNTANSGTALGLDIVMPRSKEHWIAMSDFVRNATGRSPGLGTYSNYFHTTYGVYNPNSGGNYTNQIMRSPVAYGSGSSSHRVKDGGRWWLRDNTFSEPNGDYTGNHFYGGYQSSFPNPYTGQNIGFNDGTNGYYTGSSYLVSTNAKWAGPDTDLEEYVPETVTTTTTTGGIAGSTAVADPEPVADAPSHTLVATTEVAAPTLNLDFTANMSTFPRNLKRYNTITNSSIGARFNRHESKKKRIEKSINTDTFSIELTANNASSPTTLTVTVANSKFYINGDSKPTLAFIRGETYTFDQSDASNSGHPLVLATSEDGATQYTTGWTASGTPGTDGSHAFIVPYDVPDTIYYKCNVHPNMGGEINTTFGNAFSLGDFTVAANTHVSGEYTLAVNYDGTTSNLYVDGSLITQTTRTISAGTKEFILGKEFDGYVKNFKFWNYAKHFFVAITGVLDSYSLYNDTDKIASAYGFRLLFKEYTGAHAKIKRSSDNAELDVTFEMNGDIKTPTNFTTWKGSDTLYVTKWYDQSGRGLDVVPINSSTPPVFDNAQSGGHFAGKWGATFDGSNDQELKIDNYTNSFGTGTQKYTIFCSTYWDGGTSNDTLFAIGRPDSARNVAFHVNNGGGYNHYHYGNDVTGTGPSDQTSLTLGLRYAGGASNSTNMKQWFDTTLQSGSGSAGSSLNLESGQPLRIGGYSVRGSAHYYEGRIFNFIALRTDRNDSEVTDITSKLNTY
jgi:hypothetical protein